MCNFLKRWKIKKLKKKLALMYEKRQNSPVSEAEIQKEIELLYELAKTYEKVRHNKAFPYAEYSELECYRAAAGLDDIKASFTLGKRLLERAKFWDEVRKDVYSCKTHHKYADETFEEAFAFIKEAEEKGSFQAKRLHGLSYINGWGLEANPDHGFKLVIASIEQEGSWDRATEIFKELGLNKPEFFSYIMSSKEKT